MATAEQAQVTEKTTDEVVNTVVDAETSVAPQRFFMVPGNDPCEAREQSEADGLGETIERIALAAVDGVACELGVSREDLVLALRSEDALAAFSDEQGLDRDELEQAITDGLVRAVDQADEAGALPPFVAPLVRRAAESVPPWLILETLERLGGLLPG